jgi:hypothetical protein
MGAPAAVASAVADAVAHLGIEVDCIPIRPEWLRTAIASGRCKNGEGL